MTGSLMVFLQDLAGGGAERVALLLTNGFAGLGYRVTLVLVRKSGPFVEHISPKVEVVELSTNRTALAPLELSALIRERRPDIVLSHLTHVNVSAVIAGMLAGRAGRVVLVEHNQFDRNYRQLKSIAIKIAYRLAPLVYPRAGALVSVSKGVEDVLERAAGIRHPQSYVIYNPVFHKGIVEQAAKQPDHPWLTTDRTVPVLLAVGSLTKQKDFPTFLRAVAALNRDRHVRAIILGEGPERQALEALARELQIGDRVDLPGFASNPFAYMSACNVMVMSSQWEGLPTVLVEGLGCGATIVSTDCPSGPREILLDGKIGYLARVGDPEGLAVKIIAALDRPFSKMVLQRRAEDFSVTQALESYALVLDQIVGSETGSPVSPKFQ